MTAFGHEDVAGLEVAMDDEIPMGRFDRCADLQEQLHSIASRELTAVAPVRDGTAIHVLHHQVGLALLGDAAVDQRRDVGMTQARKNLPLCAKALHCTFATRMTMQQLDRNALLILIVGTHGLAHRTHAAETDAPCDLPNAKSHALPIIGSFDRIGRDTPNDVRVEALIGALVSIEQTEQLVVQPAFAGTALLDEARARFWRKLERLLEQFLQQCHPLGRQRRFAHGPMPSSSCEISGASSIRSSMARAKIQSRFTVAGEISRAAAACSISSPPKKRSSTTRAWRGDSEPSFVSALSSAIRSSDRSGASAADSSNVTRTP